MNRQSLFRCIRILASALLALLICGASAHAQGHLSNRIFSITR